jgi:YD repeat-containing protein
VRRAYANGDVTTAAYDGLDRLKALAASTARGGRLQSLTYGYDRAGNLTSIVDGLRADGASSGARVYGYDDLYRLRTAAGGGKTWTYDFDALGNWSAKSDLGAFTYAGRAHGPGSAAGAPLAFDEAGQLTGRPGARQTFDAKGRLKTVTLDDGTRVTTTYDYAGVATIK